MDVMGQAALPATADVQLNDLDSTQQMELYALLAEFRSSMRRVETEYIFMSLKLGQMHTILGDRLFAFVQDKIGMQRYQVNRMLMANKSLTTHLTDAAGRTDMVASSRFTQGALRMFAPIEDGDVIEEVRKLAGQGEKITEKLIERVVQSHQSDTEARAALAEAEAERANKKLAEFAEQHEVATLRLEKQVNASAEQLRKAAEHRQALQQEVETLRKQATIVTEKTVDKIPDGYTSIQEAIDDANKKLEQAQQRERAVAQETERLISEQAQVKAATADLHGSVADYQEIKSVADRFLLQFPQAKIKAIAGTSAEHRSAIAGMAQAMIEFGTQLQNAVALAA
jgi:hypothetical protein